MPQFSSKPIRYIDQVKQPLIRPCPGAKHHLCCGYVVISQILGCPYHCSYCFLHSFYGKDEIVVFQNEKEILKQVEEYLLSHSQPLRVGTGEFSDSLALAEGRPLAEKLVKLFAEQKTHLLELKTKSDEVSFLLRLRSKERTVVAWSVNPQILIEEEEHGTASLNRRLDAARKCVEAGYLGAFHFDPIIYFENWQKEYKQVIKQIFQMVPAERIAWISLGTLRFSPRQRKVMQEKYRTKISFEGFELGQDHKLRYSESRRVELFSFFLQEIRSFSSEVYVYLCMETERVWQALKINNPPNEYFRFSLLR